MLILNTGQPVPDIARGPVTPLNAVWLGTLRRPVVLPQIGHTFLIFPLGPVDLWCDGAVLDRNQYMWLTRLAEPVVLRQLDSSYQEPAVLLLMLSPGFIQEMADFLGFPADMSALLHGLPLLRGDTLSSVLQQLADGLSASWPHEEIEELYLEAVGHVLRLMRLRHQALRNMAGHKDSTIAELLPRMLQVRQAIEARFLEPVTAAELADLALLSEFYFARLFRAAFDVTVYQYRLQLRLTEARRLLESTEESITAISLAVGYSSLSAFIHAFQRRYSRTPGEYRALFRPPPEAEK